MFRHQGETRTLTHNLKIASLLSFVAGNVNVIGFFAVQKLTTNVTGHFAFFVDEFFKLNTWQAFVYFLYILFFLLGAFVSNFIIEIISRKSDHFIFIVPVILESMILLLIALSGRNFIVNYPNVIACSLLFAMGLQNSLVTQISNAVVRTTHLTGLFTDLGIELSQLLFYKLPEQKLKLFSSIKLRLSIILFFFVGGICGGILYSQIGIPSLILSVVVLLGGLLWDNTTFRTIALRSKYSGKAGKNE